jgi:hypothetical protein
VYIEVSGQLSARAPLVRTPSGSEVVLGYGHEGAYTRKLTIDAYHFVSSRIPIGCDIGDLDVDGRR